MTEEEKTILEDALFDAGVSKGSCMYVELYADYRDELSDSQLKEISKSDEPRWLFCSMMEDAWLDESFEVKDRVIDEVLRNETVSDVIVKYGEDAVRDELSEMFFCELPYKHYLDQTMLVNIVVDTGDMNYDFTCNNIVPQYYGALEHARGISDCSSIAWLAKQQGIGKRELLRCLSSNTCPGDFLKSLYIELNNSTSHMNALVFCVRMTVEEYLNLRDAIDKEADLNKSYYPTKRKGRGYVVIDKHTDCGLYDSWSGSGSMIGIKLESDVKLPIRYIYKAEQDGATGYGLGDIYGCGDDLWRTDLKAIKAMSRRCK